MRQVQPKRAHMPSGAIPTVPTQFFAFTGGLDEVTPPFELKPGVLRSCLNVEVGINGGYRPFAGYERYSGKARPSAATYAVLTCEISGVVVGDVLQDNATTSYGTVIALTTGKAILTLITGTFSTGNVKVGGVVVGTCTGAQVVGGASSVELGLAYTNLAADVYRALIAAVPGSGSILGVQMYNNKLYAFRNNVGDTAAEMYVSSTSGWTLVPLGYEMTFTSGGILEPLVGTVLTGDTSTKTCTITKIILTSGTWAAGTAAGRIFYASRSGAFTSGENFSASGSVVQANILTMTGNDTAITLTKGGRYEFYNWNFGGGKKMYGCDGVNKAFEFDGTTYVPIATGMTTDTPLHCVVHKNHLFLSFGYTFLNSSIANPYTFTPITDGSEWNAGDTISGFLQLPGTGSGAALAVYTRDRLSVLYGDDAANWNFVTYSEEKGGFAYTMQYITQGFALDTMGISTLAATQEYGNFKNSIVSDCISNSLSDVISLATASCIVRTKNQYRLFFSDGTVFVMTMKDKKILGITKGAVNNPVTCICSAEGASGTEEIYFGSTDGYVYQMDKGTSYDGAAIDWFAELAFNHVGSPRQLKTFRKIVIEVSGSNYSRFSVGYSLDYGSTEYAAGVTSAITSNLSQGMVWGSFTWGSFFWNGSSLSPSEMDVTGTAENISLRFSGRSDENAQFTLNGLIMHYTPRRQLR